MSTLFTYTIFLSLVNQYATVSFGFTKLDETFFTQELKIPNEKQTSNNKYMICECLIFNIFIIYATRRQIYIILSGRKKLLGHNRPVLQLCCGWIGNFFYLPRSFIDFPANGLQHLVIIKVLCSFHIFKELADIAPAHLFVHLPKLCLGVAAVIGGAESVESLHKIIKTLLASCCVYHKDIHEKTHNSSFF